MGFRASGALEPSRALLCFVDLRKLETGLRPNRSEVLGFLI